MSLFLSFPKRLWRKDKEGLFDAQRPLQSRCSPCFSMHLAFPAFFFLDPFVPVSFCRTASLVFLPEDFAVCPAECRSSSSSSRRLRSSLAGDGRWIDGGGVLCGVTEPPSEWNWLFSKLMRQRRRCPVLQQAITATVPATAAAAVGRSSGLPTGVSWPALL